MHAKEIAARFAVSPDLNKYPINIPRSINIDPTKSTTKIRLVIISGGTLASEMKNRATNITTIWNNTTTKFDK